MSRRVLSVAILALAALAVAEEPGALRYRIDAKGSELKWDLPATLHTVHGRAPEVSGRIDADPQGADWRIEARIVAKAASMVTGNEKRDRTMREKVLEVEKYPEIVFEAKRVVGDLSRVRPGGRFTVEVSGELTVHGETLPVRLPVDVQVASDRAVLTGSFPVSWKQYGLYDPSFALVTVREPLKVSFRLTALPGGP